MPALQTISLVVLLANILPICLSHPSIKVRELERHHCRGCGDECDKCTYGTVVSQFCGELECRKGPSDICGGYSNINGVCGEGMLCMCQRCVGCSVETLKCAEHSIDEPCRPGDEMMSGYWETPRKSWFTLVK